ncbi:hypothetical protein KLP40_01655 [Hymenobacter sp. NST-14]|uniref:hypothetical protein n=1 Tax=Hymenobacter piscis TaxID=2839984 RepID=UPI001C00BDBC|nr:hypothetical protein [Hymenobacter piscis]MBT9391854.1 hypothetical protein [Hymenobacter piscis]
MKRFFLLLLGSCALLLPLNSRAQEVSAAYRTEAITITRQLAAFIVLDDARQLPVRRLTQQRLSQETEARQLYANDPDMLQKKLTAIGQEYTLQLGSLLSAAQYERYLAAAPGTLPASVAAIRQPAPTAQVPAPRTTASHPEPARASIPAARPAAAKTATVRR